MKKAIGNQIHVIQKLWRTKTPFLLTSDPQPEDSP
jgi:hypothetical protein